MKKKLVVLAGLATLSVAAFLISQIMAQAPGSAAPTAQAPPSVKVGLVNLAYVLKGYNKFKMYNDEIEKIRIVFEKKEKDVKQKVKEYQDFAMRAGAKEDEKLKMEEYIKICKRQIEDNTEEYNKTRKKKSDEQMVQMYKEIENGVAVYARSNGFHMIFHYSEPLTDADKYSSENIQRKLIGPGSSGGVCPLYIANGLDVSADVVERLNQAFPAPAVTPATGPAPGKGGI